MDSSVKEELTRYMGRWTDRVIPIYPLPKFCTQRAMGEVGA